MSTRFDEEWMPFFGDRFWESERVQELSDGALNLYQWLLWRQWKHESLPQPEALQRIVPHRWGSRWADLWRELERFFEVCPDGRLRNATLATERAVAEKKREQASDKGRNGGRARAKKAAEAQLVASGKLNPSSSTGSAHAEAQAQAQVSTGPDRTVPDKPPVVPLPGDGPGSNPPAANPEPTPAAELRAWWCGRFEAVTGKAYPWRERTDGRAADGVLELAGGDLQRVREVAERLFADPFHRRTGFDLGTLRAQWAKLLGAQPEPALRAPPAPSHRERPLWEQLGYGSEAEFREADTLRAQPKPKLLELLHEKRNGTAVHAGGGTCPS